MTPVPSSTPGPPAYIYVLVLALLGLTFAGTTMLVQGYHAEKSARADDHFIRGRVLLDSGDAAGGIAELRAAVALDRGNAAYARLLAQALAETGAAREAQTYLDGVLQRDPTNGEANLTQARVSRALGEDESAETYYRRAWFGVWPQGQQQRALVGFELADYLMERGERMRAVGVLSQLAGDMPDAAALHVRLGTMLLEIGQPGDAIAPLERAVEREPEHGGAWHALAAAHFAHGDYATARLTALRATELAPEDETARQLAETSGAVLALDPSLPRLATRERLRRWQDLLALAVDALDACDPPAEADVPSPLRAQAATLLLLRVTALDEELVLPVVEQLWQERLARCAETPPEFLPVGLVLEALGTGGRRP
jgi:tetratricopeptide (TPR) repeat protein